MKPLLKPTLQRRVLLAMSLAFVLVWLALVLYGVYRGTESAKLEQGIRSFGVLISEQAFRFEDGAQARAFVGGVVRLQNEIYRVEGVPAALVVFLWDKQENLVYTSEQGGAEALHGNAEKVEMAQIDGRSFAVFRVESSRWSIVVARANVSARWAAVVIAMEMVPELLIAYVLTFPVIWIAVSRGLLPLRDMSQRIVARDPDDLSGTGLSPKYEEMKPLQQALDGLLAKLRNKVARETAFVQEAAHELRTPMAVISAQAHVLVLEQEPVARREAEQRLGSALGRASHLIGQMLQLAHVGGERSLDAVELDMAQVVRVELALLVPSTRLRDIELSLQAPETLWVRLERETFKSILHNLVGNAIRYVEPGSKIVVSLAQQGEHLLFSVADNGPGIHPDRRELVFERFHRGADHSTPGAGLGLAIVKQACARLGGHVHVEDGLDGVGCQFIVQIPAAALHQLTMHS